MRWLFYFVVLCRCRGRGLHIWGYWWDHVIEVMWSIESGRRINSYVHFKGLLAPGLLEGTPSVSLMLPGSVACRRTFARL